MFFLPSRRNFFLLNKSISEISQKNIGHKLLNWYSENGRDLPFRQTKDPYKIWISEIIFQQTRIQQGLAHYQKFIARFPDAETLYKANDDEVLRYWKGLGYYSRAINLHKASAQIMEDFNGKFPENFNDILSLKGVGKYTAAAISSICFQEQIPAVDGNFYRVLSRIFADDFDISKPAAFNYFSELAKTIMPENKAGDFNQAMMDLGSEVCKPKNPNCIVCPVQADCLAFQTGNVLPYPVKSKKTKPEDVSLHYYFVSFGSKFLIRRRGEDFIWKKLYEFPVSIPQDFEKFITKSKTVLHKLTHKNLRIQIDHVVLDSEKQLKKFASENNFLITDTSASDEKSFPKPLEKYIAEFF